MMRGNKSKNKSKRFIVDEQFIDVGSKFDKEDIPEDEVESFNFYEYSYKLLSSKISFLLLKQQQFLHYLFGTIASSINNISAPSPGTSPKVSIVIKNDKLKPPRLGVIIPITDKIIEPSKGNTINKIVYNSESIPNAAVDFFIIIFFSSN